MKQSPLISRFLKNSGSIGGGDVKPEEYFNSFVSLDNKDVGRRKEISAKCRKFNATLWLADEYPLSLQEQVRIFLKLEKFFNNLRRIFLGFTHRRLDGFHERSFRPVTELHHSAATVRFSC